MVAIGLSGGGLAYAASSGGAPTLTPAHTIKLVPTQSGGPILIPAGGKCSRLTLTPVHGVKAPKFTKTAPVRAGHARPVACSRGKTSGR